MDLRPSIWFVANFHFENWPQGQTNSCGGLTDPAFTGRGQNQTSDLFLCSVLTALCFATSGKCHVGYLTLWKTAFTNGAHIGTAILQTNTSQSTSPWDACHLQGGRPHAIAFRHPAQGYRTGWGTNCEGGHGTSMTRDRPQGIRIYIYIYIYIYTHT